MGGIQGLVKWLESSIDVVVLSSNFPVHHIVPHPQEAFYLMVILHHDHEEPIVLFLDFKSRVEAEASLVPNVTKKDVEGYVPNLNQFKQVQKLQAAFLNSSSTNPVVKSIAYGNYLYITMTTYGGQPFNGMETPNFLIVNSEIAKRYFSFLYPLYQSLRSAIFQYS